MITMPHIVTVIVTIAIMMLALIWLLYYSKM